MGRRGPAREPDAAKMHRGKTRPSRLNGLEPLPRGRMPSVPRKMDAAAQAAWRHVTREMRASGVIAGADAHVMRIYCEAPRPLPRGREPVREGVADRQRPRPPRQEPPAPGRA